MSDTNQETKGLDDVYLNRICGGLPGHERGLWVCDGSDQDGSQVNDNGARKSRPTSGGAGIKERKETTMASRVDVEVWMMIDANGDSAVGRDADEAEANFDDQIGGTTPRRLVCMKVNVPLPEPVRVNVTLPEVEDEAIQLAEVA